MAPAAPTPSRLAARRLVLTDFRNYQSLRLHAAADLMVLNGANGAGKTNLLEALSLLAPGRGLRRARLADMQRHGAATPWAVAATLETPAGTVEVGSGLAAMPTPTPQPEPQLGSESETRTPRDRRLIRIDGKTAASAGSLAEAASLVWLTPQMDRLFIEGAAPRRRFLDRLVYGLDSQHAGRVSAFERALRERSRLLRRGNGGQTNSAWLTALEETMADFGVAVAVARRDAVARLNGAMTAAGPFPSARLEIKGSLETWLEDQPALAVEERFRGQLESGRRRDGESGGAAMGPHRSDLLVSDTERELAAADCSTGEQKALLIAIVLADARLQVARQGRPPIMLLDEIAAHLDAERRAALFDEIQALGAQAWLSGSDAGLFAALAGRAQFCQVEGGQLVSAPACGENA
ncbi:MAG: DNA replication/repair protein RecF [Alphaproteobacteria bacterium]|nr:DNA replication/repair protein RecF [Rhodospirillaceae bacterium]MDP6407484.1 DNA replication/repair protein RecF [Alphaproteobacteria bacterium]MDP6622020.1 DNA replication/repair protein RecF [Alphaproteobacteria bacterium]